MKVISWNLLRLIGAAVEDVAALVEREKPDLLLLQEATKALETLPELVGGRIYRKPLPGRIHGLAAWSGRELAPPRILILPVSRMPGRLAPRIAQIATLDGMSFANVHLSHGQILNRWQLHTIARELRGPAAIIGDFNAVGPTVLPGFRDVGPRRATHVARDVVPFRLDRCVVRDMRCGETRVLDRGPSDHCPIILELRPAPAEAESTPARLRRVPGTRRARRIPALQAAMARRRALGERRQAD